MRKQKILRIWIVLARYDFDVLWNFVIVVCHILIKNFHAWLYMSHLDISALLLNHILIFPYSIIWTYKLHLRDNHVSANLLHWQPFMICYKKSSTYLAWDCGCDGENRFEALYRCRLLQDLFKWNYFLFSIISMGFDFSGNYSIWCLLSKSSTRDQPAVRHEVVNHLIACLARLPGWVDV